MFGKLCGISVIFRKVVDEMDKNTLTLSLIISLLIVVEMGLWIKNPTVGIIFSVIIVIIVGLYLFLFFSGKPDTRKKLMDNRRTISLVAICVLAIMAYLLIAGGSDGSSSGDTGGKCLVCGKETSMQIDGAYFCFKHYNAYLHDSW